MKLNRYTRLLAVIGAIVPFFGTPETAQAAVLTIDNTDPGYSEPGGWATWQGEGEEGTNYRYADGATATATWSFTGVPAGNYMLSASYTPGGTRSTAVSYSVTGGIGTLGPVSQFGAANADFQREVGGVDSALYYMRLSNAAFEINDGTLTATVSATGGTLIADAFRLESVRPDVQAIYVIDNENPIYNNGTYSETGGAWALWGGDPGDHRSNFSYGGADSTAEFAFTGLQDGTYRVSATWVAGGTRPDDARFYVAGGPTINVDQTINPGDDIFEDASWDDLFTVDVIGGALTVNLENPAGGSGDVLIADAVRLELIPEPSLFSLLAAGLLGAFGFRRRQ
ncbi:MAG: PEP-CTERM sorting domain-containing protein [Akkermansiaceae bacterium]|nr:PEP-CTERM sorting domain-containing protein [Akkermansiaceae bacterium]MCF7731289.1 PEP-CTERM sorting domain-containing protein [Akkermansiaceae bacterium]